MPSPQQQDDKKLSVWESILRNTSLGQAYLTGRAAFESVSESSDEIGGFVRSAADFFRQGTQDIVAGLTDPEARSKALRDVFLSRGVLEHPEAVGRGIETVVTEGPRFVYEMGRQEIRDAWDVGKSLVTKGPAETIAEHGVFKIGATVGGTLIPGAMSAKRAVQGIRRGVQSYRATRPLDAAAPRVNQALGTVTDPAVGRTAGGVLFGRTSTPDDLEQVSVLITKEPTQPDLWRATVFDDVSEPSGHLSGPTREFVIEKAEEHFGLVRSSLRSPGEAEGLVSVKPRGRTTADEVVDMERALDAAKAAPGVADEVTKLTGKAAKKRARAQELFDEADAYGPGGPRSSKIRAAEARLESADRFDQQIALLEGPEGHRIVQARNRVEAGKRANIIKMGSTKVPEDLTELLTTGPDIGWSSFMRQAHKSVPGLGRIARPFIRAFNDEFARTAQTWNQLVKGIKPGSTLDKQIGKILNGDYGPSLEVLSGRIKGPFSQRALNIARYARQHYDDLYVRLQAVVPGLPYNPDYVTWIRDPNMQQVFKTPDMIRMFGRKRAFKYLSRKGEAPPDISFLESFQMYTGAALRKIHYDPMTAKLDELGKMLGDAGQRQRASIVQHFKDTMLGKVHNWDQAIDNSINNAINAGRHALGISGEDVKLFNPAVRTSAFVARGFYRGILGGNISAALNNMTQTVNTMAAAGVFNSIEGIFALGAETGMRALYGGRGAATVHRLNSDFVRLFSGPSKMDAWLFKPFNIAEFLNRGIAYHTGFSMALRQGKSLDEAMEFGVKVAGMTQFWYDETASLIRLQETFGKAVGQQMGVLVSFPLKQAEFIAELAAKGGLGEGVMDKPAMALLRYFLVTGAAASGTVYGTGALLGIPAQMSAFKEEEVLGMPLSGLEFATQIEGVPFTSTPGITGAKEAGALLNSLAGAMTRNPEWEKMRENAEVFGDTLTNVFVPAGLSVKKALRGVSQAINLQPFHAYQETRDIDTHRTSFEQKGTVMSPGVTKSLGAIPFYKDFYRGGGVVAPTSPTRELMKFLGVRPLAETNLVEANRRAAIYKDELDSRVTRQVRTALFELYSQVDPEEVKKTEEMVNILFNELGIDRRRVRATLKSLGTFPLINNMSGWDQLDTTIFLLLNPDIREVIGANMDILAEQLEKRGQEEGR